jgi:hypothetical protein
MSTTTTYYKTTSSFALGSGNGGLDTGSLQISTWYHVFALYNPTTALTDFLFSASASSPNVPTGYTYFRRIGSFKTDASNYITNFSQNGDEFLWVDPPLDWSQAANGYIGTSASNISISVPLGLKITAMLNATCGHGTNTPAIYISSPDVNDEAPTSAGTSPIGQLTAPETSKRFSAGTILVRTNTSRQIRARSNYETTSLDLTTTGYLDFRGKFD